MNAKTSKRIHQITKKKTNVTRDVRSEWIKVLEQTVSFVVKAMISHLVLKVEPIDKK